MAYSDDVENPIKKASYEAYLDYCHNLDKSKWDQLSNCTTDLCYECGSTLRDEDDDLLHFDGIVAKMIGK